MKISEDVSVNALLLGVVFLAGMIVASLTAIPFFVLIGDRFMCAFQTCTEQIQVDQSAAAASWLMVFPSVGGAVAAAVNLLLIWMTFSEQRRTRIAELRPYPSITVANMHSNEAILTVELLGSNRGKTPAFILATKAMVTVRQFGLPDAQTFAFEGRQDIQIDAPADDEFRIYVPLYDQKRWLHTAINHGKPVSTKLTVNLEYNDVFDCRRMVEFVFQEVLDDLPPKGAALKKRTSKFSDLGGRSQ